MVAAWRAKLSQPVTNMLSYTALDIYPECVCKDKVKELVLDPNNQGRREDVGE